MGASIFVETGLDWIETIESKGRRGFLLLATGVALHSSTSCIDCCLDLRGVVVIVGVVGVAVRDWDEMGE